MGTTVVACTPDFSTCDYGTAVETSGTTASYTIEVPSGEYAVAALQDTNGDGEFAGNDLFGVYTTDGTNPATVSPPATGVDITLAPLEGGTDPGPTPDASTISGTVTVAGGEDLVGTAVLACTVDFSACDYGVAIETSGASSGYTIADVPSGEYAVAAFQDTNGDEELGEGDLFGVYTTDGTNPAAVSPPATGIDITMSPMTAQSTGAAQRAVEGVEGAALKQDILRALSPHLR